MTLSKILNCIHLVSSHLYNLAVKYCHLVSIIFAVLTWSFLLTVPSSITVSPTTSPSVQRRATTEFFSHGGAPLSSIFIVTLVNGVKFLWSRVIWIFWPSTGYLPPGTFSFFLPPTALALVTFFFFFCIWNVRIYFFFSHLFLLAGG